MHTAPLTRPTPVASPPAWIERDEEDGEPIALWMDDRLEGFARWATYYEQWLAQNGFSIWYEECEVMEWEIRGDKMLSLRYYPIARS